MRFQLQVVRGRGTPSVLELDVPTIDAARQQALSQGYLVLACTPSAGARLGASFLQRSTKPVDLLVFIEQLRDLLVAGLALSEALLALGRAAESQTAQLIERLRRELQQGQPLSKAMAKDPAFPGLLIALVSASEMTSDLPQTLTRFLEHEQRMADVRHRVFSSTIYPALLVAVGGAVLLFLLFYVMPRFARIFEGISGDLPWSARWMISWSEVLGQNRVAWMTGLMLTAVLALSALSNEAFRRRSVQVFFAWAPLRKRIEIYFLARWYRATGMLVQGGIPLPQALGLANGLLPASLTAAGHSVEAKVRDGLLPSQAYSGAGMATPVAEQLMVAGERTGDLGTVLTRIAQFHETETTRSVERLMRTAEPLLMVLIGLAVGLVVVLMYLPIFELASAIQ